MTVLAASRTVSFACKLLQSRNDGSNKDLVSNCPRVNAVMTGEMIDAI